MSYRELKSYQTTTIIYDFTVNFCKKYLFYKSKWSNKSYRTVDQMIQAARSGKQNIVEGCSQRTSKKTEIKLLGVARASLEELLVDYEDFLRQNKLPIWEKSSMPAAHIRNIAYQTDKSYQSYESYLDTPEKAGNAMLCLISQATYLLDKQIASVQKAFITEGGWTENIFHERLKQRSNT